MWAAPHQNQTTRQFNAKAVWNVGAHRFGAVVATSRASQANYAYLSKDMLARGLGYDWNIYAPDWDRAVAAARGRFSGGVNSPWDAYYSGHGLRNDDLSSIAGDFGLNESMRLKVNVYNHSNRGQGHWWAPGQPSYPGTDRMLPISIRSTNYTINRDGLTAALSWTVGIHELEAGLWFEQNDHNVSRNFYYISGPFLDDLYLKNPDRLLFNQDFDIRTRQFYVQDRFRLFDDRLTIDIGAKSPHTRTSVRTPLGSYANNSSLTARKGFLPQAGFNFKLNEGNEIFGSFAKNIAAYALGVGSPFNVPQAAFDASAKNLKQEQSRTLELGWRGYGQGYAASVAVYDVKFDNRLLAIAQCVGILGCPAL
ncbi:hypothetical protein G6F32_013254 [Rhizopus arrhizus]|nr:hypothetical protein G6F32_013254 [Rhizopus arrhizus]